MKKVSKKVIGIDFGTLSARAVMIDAQNGNELGEAVSKYRHAVIDDTLPCGKKLAPKTALQHPADYLEALYDVITEVLKETDTEPAEIAALGLDFTACTLISAYKDGTPLCFDPKYEKEPNAYAMLWKHHASQPDADRLLWVAKQTNESWTERYGGKLSPEWQFSKILQILRQTPEIYDAADRFLEAGDWLTLMITGSDVRSASMAGFKALWDSDSGYPSDEYFKAVDRRLSGIIGTKVSDNVVTPDAVAGYVNKKGSKLTGLCEGTPVALPVIDAHAAMPALGITRPGELMMVLGTSGCHIIHSNVKNNVSGIHGYANEAIMPGLCTYEAGQAGLGDGFDWFVKNCVPESYKKRARQAGIDTHTLLTELASSQKPGEHGLLALDWINGNRCILNDSELSGTIIGITLDTNPEDIYRAIIEATAYGTRKIIENFEQNGIEVKSICATGGIALKNKMMMQIYADVTGREIRVSSANQAGAYGSALYAAVAGGEYKSIIDASNRLAKPDAEKYVPNQENHRIYTELYNEYTVLHDYFGRGENNIMKKLDKLKREVYDNGERD